VVYTRRNKHSTAPLGTSPTINQTVISMIMDDVAAYIEGMDEMDDLFLDPVQSAALPAALMPARLPVTRGLLQRLDELGACGACQ